MVDDLRGITPSRPSFSGSPTRGSYNGPTDFAAHEGTTVQLETGGTPLISSGPGQDIRSPFHSSESHILHQLSASVVFELCKLWFRKYHRFFPILHHPSFDQLLRRSEDLSFSIHGVVVQAIIAITLQHSEIIDGNLDERKRQQEQLAANVVVECIKQPCLQSIQALLILSILQYGEGKMMQSWNFLAMARRMGAHVGLSHTISDDRTPEMSPTALRRLPTFTNTTVQDEEKIRAYW